MPLSRADGSVPSRAEKGKARAVLNRLRRRYVSIGTALDYESPFQLLVVTVLSAQTTDERVNLVTPALFARYPTPADLAAADPADVEDLVRTTGFFRNKTKSIMGMASALVERFGGEVPHRMADLVTIPGMGHALSRPVVGPLADAILTHTTAVDTADPPGHDD